MEGAMSEKGEGESEEINEDYIKYVCSNCR